MSLLHQILVGDCIDMMRTLPDQSVNTCVTSPPYFGLRDYGMADQIGLEQTPAEFIARLVLVFREVRRVLRDDGTIWVNMGDTYASIAGGYVPGGSTGKHDIVSLATRGAVLRGKRRSPPNALKQKDLMGIPWRLAFALQDDGWYLRQDIIWHKPNPMPESTRDRCTKAHEYLFLLSKSPRYYYDQSAIQEPAFGGPNRNSDAVWEKRAERRARHSRATVRPARPGRSAPTPVADTRNKRSVWTVATAGY